METYTAQSMVLSKAAKETRRFMGALPFAGGGVGKEQ
jgi:hypothetical protein